MVLLYGIFGRVNNEITERELLILLLLGGLGVLTATITFAIKRITWYKAKIEEVKLTALQDSNFTLREQINALKQMVNKVGKGPH